jgi:branched-chain amino acid aminotransferase
MSGVVVWANGALRDPEEPLLSALDHGVTVGDGVFETCAVVRGQVVAPTRHLQRLTRSAVGLGLDAPDLDRIRAGIAEVLAAGEGLGRLRVTVTAGLGPLGSGRLPSSQTILVVAGPAAAPAPVRVVRTPWVRNERSAVAGVKSTSYAENAVALAYARERDADEALFANTVGELCEGTGTNVFVEVDGRLVTPPLSSGCLAGITRDLVLEWSAVAGLPVREGVPGELPFSILDRVTAGEATLALTGSVRTVVPVIALDGTPVPVGPLTDQVQQLYREREESELGR